MTWLDDSWRIGEILGTDRGRSVFDRFREGDDGSVACGREFSGFSGNGYCGGGAGGSGNRGFASVWNGMEVLLASDVLMGSTLAGFSASLRSPFDNSNSKK